MLEKIDIEISESKSEVNFDTDAENVNSTGKTKVNVVYDVKAPVWINADLEQSYGNVYIQELTGIAELEIRYGNLTATALMNETEDWNTLDLKYGAASIDHLTALTAEVKYSELTVKESGIMETESAYSKLFLGSVSELSSECKYDKLNIDMVESALHVDGAYTNVTVGELSKDFAEVVVDLAYGNFKAGLESGAAFKIEADVSYGSARIPDGDYMMEKQATNVEVDGNIGGKSDALLVADIKYGNLVLE